MGEIKEDNSSATSEECAMIAQDKDTMDDEGSSAIFLWFSKYESQSRTIL